MENIKQESLRIIWLDWMKVWAILSIIWGHFFSEGHVYLYVYSVQVFCVISGFLYKKSPNWTACIQKNFWQLLVPTVLMSFIMHLEAHLRCLANGSVYEISWSWFFKWLLLGHRWCMGPCWYFYSLAVIRFIMQSLPEKKWVYGLAFMIMSACAIFLSYAGFEASNAIINVTVCMPFFLIGVYMKPYKNIINAIHNYRIEVVLFIISVVVIIICGNYNGYVWMYLNNYGNNFALYILGGLAGTSLLYAVSLWLSRLPYRAMAYTLSRGSILIIGLHIIIVRRLTDLPDRTCLEDFCFSLLILLFFIPVIKIVSIFFPILLGQYKIKKGELNFC